MIIYSISKYNKWNINQSEYTQRKQYQTCTLRYKVIRKTFQWSSETMKNISPCQYSLAVVREVMKNLKLIGHAEHFSSAGDGKHTSH